MVATIKDVAKHAGVSIATVSRVLNDSASVSPYKRKKVLQAIDELNYRPNIIAQRMANQNLNNIAILPSHASNPEMINPYIAQMLLGFQEVTRKNSMEILLLMEENNEAELQKCIDLISGGVVRGIILIGARIYDETIIELSKLNFPFVIIGYPHATTLNGCRDVNSVDIDSYNDAKAAVKHLIDKGHKRIALIHAPLEYIVSQDRYDGYISAIRAAGLEVSDELIFEAGYGPEAAFEASEKILRLDNPPSAVMTTDDVKALAFISKARQMGYDVPKDFSVIGHDDYPESRISSPPLTTISVPMEDLAVAAAELLMAIIENPDRKPQRVLLPTKFIERQTVKDLHKNITFIHHAVSE